MGIKQKTVFISYRRTNFYTALAVYQDLTAHGYDCFFDYESIESGSWEAVIFENIRYRAHFVVILSPSALERLGEKNSVMRREVELAIDEKRNIIPLMMESFDFGSPSTKEALTGKLETLSSYNGLKLVPEYIFAGMEKLRRFLDVELEDIRRPSLSVIAEENTEKRQVRASEEPDVEEKSLTAEEWFERGYKSQMEGNHKEAIRCYEKALEISPDISGAYSNLGVAFSDLKRYAEAEEAYRKGIELNPEYATAYSNLGLLLHEKLKRYEESEAAYRKGIELNPEYATAYSNLGNLLSELKRYAEAEEAYRKAIELNPEDATAYSNLGNLLSELKRYEESEAAYRKAIELNPEYATAYYNLGNLLSELKRYEESEAAYRKAIEINPEFTGAYNNLGNLLYQLEKLAEAATIYSTLLDLQKGNVAVRVSLFGVLKKLGREKEAKEHENIARKAIEKESEYNHACFESLCGNIDEALPLLKIAIEKEQAPIQHIKQDPDLENLHADPRFWEIIGEEMPKQ